MSGRVLVIEDDLDIAHLLELHSGCVGGYFGPQQ